MLAISELPSERLRQPLVDRWLPWLTLVSTAIVAILTLLCRLPGLVSFLIIPLSLVGYLAAPPALVAASVWFAANKLPRKAASALIALATPILLWVPINWAADCVHLGLTAGFGAGQIGAMSKPDGSKFAAYDWSTGLAGGPNTFLIHDDSDEIALPLARHKHPAASENGFGEDCAGKVKHLLAHYYVCTF
jgi:hypothetical protein